jgi:hypothetical protein
MSRHLEAMMDPRTPEESSIVNLTGELARLSDRYRHDRVMLPSIENLATCIIRIAANGNAGRIDPGTVDKQVRDMVRRAGGDADNVG